MKIMPASLTMLLLLSLLIIISLAPAACTSQPSASNPPSQSQSQINPSDNTESTSAPSQTSPTVSTNHVNVVVVGYINHGPMQPTVRAIKEVLSKYDDKVTTTWIDLATSEGQSYAQEHGLTAHMNVIINGTSIYQVNGKTVDFEWFEGQQWTKEDLDSVLSNLVSK